ncbi:hypothetical protein [Aliiroseovarius sp.]|uniref:hypothetical protein n=1 Tax=Aliiroseovarius sp. TaxID=1872442 RepID=UPI0026241B04|nr:hypothetical protein [Aliiroseovarius sp.]
MSPPRILVHAGFYKTGTTSLQGFLADNRAALAPWFAYYGQGDFHGAGARAREYAQAPFPNGLKAFRLALRRFLSEVPDGTDLVLSRENFTGAMPGHRDWLGRPITGFPAAKPLLRDLRKELFRRFGPDTRVEILFTTRTREAWLRSVHGHLLRSIRLEDDFDDFARRFRSLGTLEEEARRLDADHISRVEAFFDHPAGPAKAVLDLMGVPEATQASLTPARHRNAGQSGVLKAEFLRLNRSGLSKPELKAAKATLLERGS